LSLNPNAIHILEHNLNKIKWNVLSLNPSIFEIDKSTTKKAINDFVSLLKN
jgi:hypothetical protein